MTIWQAFIEALESISGNKLRSGLTVLGIVIGVAAVIAMLAVGQGAQASITGSISGIGTNLLFVFRGDQGDNVRNPKPLTLGDAEALERPVRCSFCRSGCAGTAGEMVSSPSAGKKLRPKSSALRPIISRYGIWKYRKGI